MPKLPLGLLNASGLPPLASRMIAARAGFTVRSKVPLRGIIPARAGFTGSTPSRPARSTDHPRSRGVYSPQRRIRLAGLGSSPLARGLLGGTIRICAPPRIIPARAGFTPMSMSRPFRRRDHPRSRGVYAADTAVKIVGAGSSPLARGLRAGGRGRASEGGIIPARAGFTMPPC